MFDLRSLYEQLILDHNRNPRNYPKRPEGTNRSAHGLNPQCGDEFRVHLKIEDGVIQDVGFEGGGCAISTASASMMTESVKGKSVADVEALFNRVHDVLTREGEGVEGRHDLLGKLAVLVGVKEYPLRVKCATLAWHTLHAALTGHHATVTTE
jgi:nitrogen fixation protein NifU and related proteins